MTGRKVTYRSPLYLQLREVIRGKIESGEYPPGTWIPSENQLAETYGLNRLSVRSALSALQYEGLLHSVQGKGVFVTGSKVERDLETLGGFRQTMRDRQQTPSTRILTKAVRKAGALYAQLLQLQPEDEVYYIRRICSSDEAPQALEEIFIPVWAVPNLYKIDIGRFSVYDAYAWSGVTPVRGEQTLSITRLDPSAARLIGLTEQDPVLDFRCVTYDTGGHAIEFSHSFTRNDRCVFTVRYQK